MKTNETKQKFIELRAKGLSFDKIAKELNVSKPTLIEWRRDFSREIESLRLTEFESLAEQYSMVREARIKRLASDLEKIDGELEKRDLEKVSTEKLYSLKYSLIDRLQKELSAVKYMYQGIEYTNDLTGLEQKDGYT
jgi:hypothetical protein